MVAKITVLWLYFSSFFNMVVVPCVTVPENWEYCYKDMDVWLLPEVERGAKMVFGEFELYKEEKEILEEL